MGKLEGKIALVTGGSSGIGLASARRFVAEGARVIITGRDQIKLDKAVANIGAHVEGIQSDIASLADLERLHDHVKLRYRRLDIIFANAGIGGLTPLGQVSEHRFDLILDTNVKGTFFTVQTLLPLMPDGGSIILTTSISASMGFPASSVYSGSKAMIRSFARTWTADLKDRRIRVNAISPGTIDTPVFEAAGLDAEQVKDWLAAEASRTPLGRVGAVEEIASAALFLASDESSFVTGIELTVDGGTSQV